MKQAAFPCPIVCYFCARIKKIGDLDFDFYDGTCAGTKTEMYLCFSQTKYSAGFHLGLAFYSLLTRAGALLTQQEIAILRVNFLN